jgi:hypothetical protein
MPDAKQGHDKKHYEDAERSQLSGTQYRSVAHTPRQRHDRTVPGTDGQRQPEVYGYRSQTLLVVPTTGATQASANHGFPDPEPGNSVQAHGNHIPPIAIGAGFPEPVCAAGTRGSVEVDVEGGRDTDFEVDG